MVITYYTSTQTNYPFVQIQIQVLYEGSYNTELSEHPSDEQVPFEVTPELKHPQIRQQITPEVPKIFPHSNAPYPHDNSDHQTLQKQSTLPQKSDSSYNIPEKSINSKGETKTEPRTTKLFEREDVT